MREGKKEYTKPLNPPQPPFAKGGEAMNRTGTWQAMNRTGTWQPMNRTGTWQGGFEIFLRVNDKMTKEEVAI